ncbi:MAG: hypothetical protein A2452_11110 [Candidatus Firestonebacteria bacterium RIFOXYC2_FULL_39_67]|nr:MAG: hypothetical protein A2452_11110 [Candidatus Firestonebacteria bacterium RIFOXYC2_FULL_39_67]
MGNNMVGDLSVTESKNSFCFKKSTYKYEVFEHYNISKGKKVLLNFTDNKGVEYKDHVLLASGKSRHRFAKNIKGLFPEIDEKLFERELMDTDSFLREAINRKKPTNESECEKEVILSEQEKLDAVEVLKNPNLMEEILLDLENIGCTGEVLNKKLLILTYVSCKISKPLGLLVKGESSSGKSFLISKIGELFPPEYVVSRTRLTSQALFYLGKDFLKNKVLIIAERDGVEGTADYSIRCLQSEQQLSISVPNFDKESGRINSDTHIVNGPIAYIESTTQSNIYVDNENRSLSIFLDNSEEHTLEIYKTLCQPYLMGSEAIVNKENICKRYQNAFRTLKSIVVKIPYIDLIKFPTKPIRVRRDFSKFISLIETSAFLYQYQREKVVVDGVEYIIANLEDYRLAYDIASVILARTIKELSIRAEELVRAFEKILSERIQSGNNENVVNRYELCKILEWSLPTLTKYIEETENMGYVQRKSGKQGKSYEYVLVKKLGMHCSQLLSPEELQKLTESNNNVLTIENSDKDEGLESNCNIINDEMAVNNIYNM